MAGESPKCSTQCLIPIIWTKPGPKHYLCYHARAQAQVRAYFSNNVQIIRYYVRRYSMETQTSRLSVTLTITSWWKCNGNKCHFHMLRWWTSTVIRTLWMLKPLMQKNSKTGFLHFNALLNPDPVLHGGYYATGAQVAQFLLAKIFRYPRCVAAFDKLSEVCC